MIAPSLYEVLLFFHWSFIESFSGPPKRCPCRLHSGIKILPHPLRVGRAFPRVWRQTLRPGHCLSWVDVCPQLWKPLPGFTTADISRHTRIDWSSQPQVFIFVSPPIDRHPHGVTFLPIPAKRGFIALNTAFPMMPLTCRSNTGISG